MKIHGLLIQTAGFPHPMMSAFLSRLCLLLVLLLGMGLQPARAEENIVPPPAATSPAVSAPSDPAAAPPVDQPPAAFNSGTGSSTAAKKSVKKKKKKHTTDFAKKHHAKPKAKTTPRASAITPPTVYDPAVSEPTEEVMAIKNRAESKFWEGRKRPASGIASGNSVANMNQLERASASQLAGVTFDDQPLRMPESETFRRSLDTVGFELGRPCKAREYLGWPLRQTEQTRVNQIFSDTLEKFHLRGYSVTPRSPKAAGKDVSVFTADREGVYDKHILGLWSAGDVGLILLVCETDRPAEVAKAKETSKKKKAPAKKEATEEKAAPESSAVEKPATDSSAEKSTEKSAEKPAEKPTVVPGAGASDAASKKTAPVTLTPPPAAPVVPVPPAAPSAPAAAPAPAAPPPPAPAPTSSVTPPAGEPILAPVAPAAPVPAAAMAPAPQTVATPIPGLTATAPATPDAAQGKETPSPVDAKVKTNKAAVPAATEKKDAAAADADKLIDGPGTTVQTISYGDTPAPVAAKDAAAAPAAAPHSALAPPGAAPTPAAPVDSAGSRSFSGAPPK